MLVHNSGNTKPVDVLFAYLSVDKDGNEGVCAAPLPGFGTTPLVFGYEHVALKFIPIAEEIAKASGMQIKLVKFTKGEVVQTIGG